MRTLQVILVSATALSAAAPLYAQEDPARPPKHRFFRKTRVSFWDDLPPASPKKAEKAQRSQHSIWAEPMRLPDGRMSLYVPPPHVLRFLEDPSDQNGLAYLAVQIEKNAKMMRAQEVLARLRRKLLESQAPEPHGIPAPPTEEPKKPSVTARAEILYFKSDT